MQAEVLRWPRISQSRFNDCWGGVIAGGGPRAVAMPLSLMPPTSLGTQILAAAANSRLNCLSDATVV